MSWITLENDRLRTCLDPSKGVGVKGFWARSPQDPGVWLALMPDTRQAPGRLGSSSFLMVPYSNRIENGLFTFQNTRYQLDNGEQHAIHGDVRERPWEIAEATAHRARCAFRSVEHANVNWPWPFEAQVEYALRGNVFASRLSLWNRGDSPMPAGFGWHPYYNRTLTRPGEPVRLRLQVTAAYPDANDNRIPSGPPEPLAPELDFSTERELDPDQFIDTCFQGYDGDGSITWPESGIRLVYDCSAACTHLVLYNPVGVPVFAVEPVTNANNGVNLYASDQPGSGVVVLAPGECLEATFDIRVEVL